MSDDLVKRLREHAIHLDAWGKEAIHDADIVDEAADHIEKLESVTMDDAKWLAAYHKWCQMNGCAPSSSDLITARKALEGKDV
jgi:hypothetical protein